MLYNVGIKPYLPIVNWNNPITKKMIVDLSLSEGGGKVLHNLANPSTNFTLQGTANWQKSQFGYANVFAGGGDFGKIVTPVSNVTTNFTLQAIVAQNSTTGEQELFGSGSTFDGYYMNINGGTFSVLYPGVANISSVMTVTLGSIAHLVVTRDGGTTRFYLNGVLGTATATNTPNAPTGQSSIGARGDNVNPFKGTIFNARLWTRCLSKYEVYQLYETPWGLYNNRRFIQNRYIEAF